MYEGIFTHNTWCLKVIKLTILRGYSDYNIMRRANIDDSNSVEVNMKLLSNAELKQVAGGFTVDGITVAVPSTGIPTYHFNNIDYALSMTVSGAWTSDQGYSYLEYCGSDYYIDMYLNNMLIAYPEAALYI